MLRNFAIPAVVLIALGVWIAWISWDGFLNFQTQKDKHLARMTAENLGYLDRTADNFVSFKCSGPGEYICETSNLDDAIAAGKFGYNAMVVLVERNGVVMTGRGSFVIHGFQNGTPIFDVHYSHEGLPVVTLLGPYAEIDFAPTFSRAEPQLIDSETPKVSIPS